MSITSSEQAELERLRAENAALRKDAERYAVLLRRIIVENDNAEYPHDAEWSLGTLALDAHNALNAMREDALQAPADQA